MGKLDKVYALRANLRRLAVDPRVRGCGQRVLGNNAAVRVQQLKSGDRRAWFAGVFQCNRQHSCPVCGGKRTAARADELTRMQHADEPGKWRMLTLTMRHHRGQRLAPLVQHLMKAWRSTRSTRQVRALFDRYVSASARALEVTWSERNGWHPHLHIVVRSPEWSRDDWRTLERVWLSHVRALRGVGVKWSETPAAYISKMKLAAELAGIGKDKDGEHMSPFQLAELALERPELVKLWREYQRAMRGRRMLEMDERAKRLAEAAPLPPEQEVESEWTVLVAGKDYRELAALEKSDSWALWLLLDSCCVSGTDPPNAVSVYLEDRLGHSPRPAGN